MYSSLRTALLTGGLTFSVIVGTLSVYALGAGTDIVALMDKLLVDTTISTDGTVKNSDKVDGLHASDILNAAGGGTITFSTCSTTDKKQMFYECDPTLAACLTPGAYCGGGVVAGSYNGSLIVTAISDDSEGISWGYTSTTYGNLNGALEICANKESFGYDGWQLPNKYELNLICTNKSVVGNIDTLIYYWSSSEQNASINNAYTLSMNSCSINFYNKDDQNRVRCIRKY